ncbi:MAG: hypothetical protein QM803_09345 [Rhodocyclaceae bacterium]
MIRSPELAPTSVAHRYGLSILTSLILFSLPSVGQADEAKHWRIAILRSGDPAQPAFAQMDRSFRQTIEAAAPAGVEFTTDAIDGLRFSGADLAPELVAMLRKKYAAHQVDLVVVIGDVALDLADRYRDEVWPGIPIMAGGIENSRLEARGRPLDMPVAPLRVDVDRTLAVIEALQPSATNLIVISGMSPVDRRWLDRASRTAAQRPSRAWNIEQWVGLSIEELQQRLKALPRNTAVLYTTMYQDHAGRRYFPVDAVRPMVQASAVPIYGWYANFVEQGLTATGGPMDFPQEGKRLGDMALAMLAGRPTTRYTEAPASKKCVVNVGQVEALGLDLDTVPAHCQLINWPPSVWRDHRVTVIAIAAIIVLQGASIAALLTLRRQRQSAEREAARRRVELANASRVAAAGELSASIAHEVGQPLGAILSNTDAAEMILDTGIDDEGELREILADVRRDAVRANSVVR